jgi:alkanesulfonate monooxygenase SsuD/methylene tetrahydromethanopterin reductase-like flavin-dependent oxidoreductase (luciferase family)
MRQVKFGVQVWLQSATWPPLLDAGRRVDELGYDYLLGWDHLLSPVGDGGQPVLEGYAVLAAWAATTRRSRLGLLVGANAFRNPGLVAKTITTIDHISGGRAILGLGAGWHEREHDAYGIPFGRSPGERLAWLEEALQVNAALLSGAELSYAGRFYRTDELALSPPSVQRRIPILVGGTGERRTLRSVALHADMWSAGYSVDEARRLLSVLRGHCDDVGRDIGDIELGVNFNLAIRSSADEALRVLISMYGARGLEVSAEDPGAWAGTPEMIAERILAFRELGFSTFVTALPAPYDEETLVRFAEEVGPLVGRTTPIGPGAG